MNQKILITGAAGFIGSHLVELLLKEVSDNQLRLLIYENDGLSNLPKKNFEIVKGDVRDKSVVKRAMDGVKTVYHLAAKIDFEGKTYKEYRDVNVLGTQNLLDRCRGKNIQKFVFFSSIAVYGLPASVGDIINWDETQAKTYTNFYGRSKLEAEDRILRAHKLWGVPYTIVRPASVYGPREKGPTLALFRAIKNRQFVMIGSGANKMHYVYVTDLVKGARLAQLSKKKSGGYILAGGDVVTLNDLANLIAKNLGVKVYPFFIPRSLVLGLSYGSQFIGKLFKIKSPLFPSRVKTMTSTYFYNINKAKEELGYQPKINIEKGVGLTAKWYIKNHYL